MCLHRKYAGNHWLSDDTDILRPHATYVPLSMCVCTCRLLCKHWNYMYWRHRHPVKCFSGIFNQKQLILFQFNLWMQLGDFCSWISLFGLTEFLCALSMSQPHKGVLCVNLQGGGRRIMEVQSKLLWKIQHQGANGNAERVPNLTFHSPHQKCFSGGWGWKNIWILANKIEVRMMGLTFLYMC